MAASIGIPSCLYPDVAPLPVPLANHLLLQEERKYRRRLSKRPDQAELIQAVLDRIHRARNLVYEYLHPFVTADRKRQERGEHRAFPNSEWLLETLAQYAPGSVRYATETLDYWQKKGLLRREKTRGLLDISSVSALLTARLAEENLQRNWLPSTLHASEPHWWCYGRLSPDEQVQSLPVPLPSSLPASLVVWTPWQGAIWEDQWHRSGGVSCYRWAGSPFLEDLLLWEKDLPSKILDCQQDSLFGRASVQHVLLQEAREDVLASIMRKERDR